MSSNIHHAAAGGYATAAASYVKGRPDYPPEVSAWLKDSLGLGPGTTVLDLGAGTGKFTPRLLDLGATVIAVEPVPAMLATLSATLPQVQALAGTATSIPLPDASVDAVVCAQAFHWFATPAALDEILRVLKPGGRLGLVWNLRDASVPWVASLDAIVNRVEGDTPRYYTGAWRHVFPHAGLTHLQETQFSQEHTGTAEDVLFNRVRSTSFIAALPPQERQRIDDEIRQMIASEPALRGRDSISVPYRTAAFVAQKAASAGI
ncbi:class I SAM-dependent methyltransferase [Janthinobacterium sp. EB271-G4-7A]|uniref:class I SAM-dependent methyltransferase n=1 Tax=Janthinobacterium sp. EB271-G4-7A TaxID=2775056 RepID=UPI001E47AA49|nr:class I SAM-dependent methyltransferase [Janthinobacterium sp. EB271-G4-7A]MCC7697464.1 methyltransferase domain-containing protein [Janthinobacterium sp. EB271-G4-7A]